MKIITAETMRALDQRAMQKGIPGVVLMENAGRAVYEQIAQRFAPISHRAFAIACGPGNNGGDGYVVARYLKLAGASVTVHMACDVDRITGDARVHFDLMRAIGIVPAPHLPDQAIRVDALLGTGAQGAPRGVIADLIRCINAGDQPIISIDLPSGVQADTGAVLGEAVNAHLTVTFAYPKLGHFLYPGASHCGEIVVDPIGFEWELLDGDDGYRWFDDTTARSILPPRDAEGHKGVYGHVLVVGGSTGMSGAPTMTARAALRTGAGLVSVAAPLSAQPIIASKIDEAMTIGLPETEGAFGDESFGALQSAARRCGVLCLGPGISQKPEAQRFILRTLNEIDKPTVLDADGLNALARLPEALIGRNDPLVLTPHPAECARLLGVDTATVQADRISAVRRTAAKYHCVVVLKGAHSLICDGRADQPEDRLPVSVCCTGNPGMATGGSGDVLTGVIGALLAQSIPPYDAACLGVYLHGLAGDLAQGSVGQTALVAGDIIMALPQAIRSIEETK